MEQVSRSRNLGDHRTGSVWPGPRPRCQGACTVVAAFTQVSPRNDPLQELATVQKLRKEFQGVPHLTVPGFKIFADGVVEYPSQTAALTKPYKNTGRSGDLLFDSARFSEL